MRDGMDLFDLDIGIGDDPEDIRQKHAMKKLIRWQAIIAIGALVGFFAAASYAWLYAPPVGGDVWFYLRFIVAFVAGIIGFIVGRLVTFFALVLCAFIAKKVGDRR